ncbi:MAG TPA: 2-oxoacid:acceptor oxidoreductase subunit alpha [Humidesulfovibrio sp.]|uniref:2-oxoacid:acceptor oxidoreductase subunit alpha n=1 Tax=Humidesulfovibrio sp. TaxID=2910988 RepID=UPI002C2A4795|nr:2-oxoacid:acceptor oxidoreductase subunit alpha [Humidesulfovibrio sp.]HWR02616.1 2-oxoacid:acceptor oxidoreductase subunit alpha [Humidesulfovibrio sp.]
MPDNSIVILVGGEAGQGLVTIGQLMAKALVRAGYEVCVVQDYQSRIRGGHNTFVIRTGLDAFHAPSEKVDILVALNAETLALHKHQLTPGGIVLADEALDTTGLNALRIPFKKLAPKAVYENVVALGVVASALCKDLGHLEDLLRETFGKKGQEVVEQNLAVLRAAYAWVRTQEYGFACMPPPPENPGQRLMLTGNEAVALGALAAGCNFCSFYPMTPGSSVALSLAEHAKDMGTVVEQAEDEIAAANMAVGAACAGARAIVPTSGGGFALMVEAVSLAGMLETPVVFLVAMRPGPATGLPTRTEQADLNLVLYAGHGEFPRAVFTPGSVDECFYLAHRAFEMAEKYQSPVFVLTDQYLADSFQNVEPFDLASLPELPAPLLAPDDPKTYKRFALTEDGVSPRAIPGFSEALVVSDSDEHTEDGKLTEDLDVRVKMVTKRLAKGVGLAEDAVPPGFYGEDDAELLLVCWGSTLHAAMEARELLEEAGRSVAVLHFSQVWPLNGDQFLPRLEAAGRAVCVEGNATGQLARLIRQETGFRFTDLVLRFDGLPISAAFILRGLESIL